MQISLHNMENSKSDIKLSICIATYNRAEFLKETLDNVVSQTNDDDDVNDDMDELINSHLRDISAEQRPQMSSAGLSMYNKHFTELTNHELHQIKKMKEKKSRGGT